MAKGSPPGEAGGIAPEIASTAWARPAAEVSAALGVEIERGLAAGEARRRLGRWGENRLRTLRRPSALEIFVQQFKSLVVLLLALATAFSFALGDAVEASAIAAVLTLNALLGFTAELRARRSMEALASLESVTVRVRRGGRELEIPARELVPGDVLLLGEGDVVAADARLIEAYRLAADESALTGESLPVEKSSAPVAAAAPLAERAAMVWKGTAIPRGSGVAVAVATGMGTELGRITRLVEEAREEATPLEQRLATLGRRLIVLTLGVAALTVGLGVASGRDARLMIETGIALAVAAIPEGLPIVATIALARGMWRMARRRALVRRLSAVETLGSTTVILSDKTGTLTENRLEVARLVAAGAGGGAVELEASREYLERLAHGNGDGGFGRLLEIGVLCNNAALAPLPGRRGLGDPLEVALLAAGAAAGIERAALLDRLPEIDEAPFDASRRLMATLHQSAAGGRLAVKGAAEAVLAAADRMLVEGEKVALDETARRRWLEAAQQLAAAGFRVVALAERAAGRELEGDPYRELVFCGLVALRDPPRDEVRPALAACRRAGIRVVMVTGDQPATARAIAGAVGLSAPGEEVPVVTGAELGALVALSPDERRRLLSAPIFARVDPAQKLELIALHQEAGEVVAMTGDGVNDAPALKKADIGVAMGRRGTQVAREAADIVLEDDAFSSIVAAVEHGRVIFGNIRKFVVYLLSCNSSEILLVGSAAAIDMPLPVLPLQILFLNLVTDVFPALALALGSGASGVMAQPPRDPAEAIVGRTQWRQIGAYGVLVTLSVLGALYLALAALGLDAERAVTVSFLTLALAQLWHVFNMREPGSRFLANEIVGNPWIWAALALCLALLAAAIEVPLLARVLAAPHPGREGLALALAASLVPWTVGQLALARTGRDRPSGGRARG